MSIAADEDIVASDFISTSAGAADEGKVPKLNVVGKLHPSVIQSGFGGNGADGALTVSSGTTDIDLGGAQVVVKNYTSISITGTGKVTFSNPHVNGTTIILKSQGNVTLTSSEAPMLDASGMGGQGGGSQVVGTSSSSNGSSGNNGYVQGQYKSNLGGAGTTNSPYYGAGGASLTNEFTNGLFSAQTVFWSKIKHFFIGAGGGSGSCVGTGSTTTATTGAGGSGGGALIIECAGAWNFTTASGISVAGKNGGTGVLGGTPNGNSMCAGGGGGGGGFFLALYNILTANTGTITKTGGTGGNSSVRVGTINENGGGGGGGGLTAGTNGTSNITTQAKTGGDGGTGYSLVALNTEFA